MAEPASRPLLALAALSAATAIAADAFGAHAAASPWAADLLHTGGKYQLAHALAVLLLDRWPGLRKASIMFFLGSLIFAATLYLMALGAPRWLGAVTPVGGLLMIGGWLWAAWRLCKRAAADGGSRGE